MTIVDYIDSLKNVQRVQWGPNNHYWSNEKISSVLLISAADCVAGYDLLQGSITWIVMKGGKKIFANDYICCAYSRDHGKSLLCRRGI